MSLGSDGQRLGSGGPAREAILAGHFYNRLAAEALRYCGIHDLAGDIEEYLDKHERVTGVLGYVPAYSSYRDREASDIIFSLVVMGDALLEKETGSESQLGVSALLESIYSRRPAGL